jgi:hypothetical protein
VSTIPVHAIYTIYTLSAAIATSAHLYRYRYADIPTISVYHDTDVFTTSVYNIHTPYIPHTRSTNPHRILHTLHNSGIYAIRTHRHEGRIYKLSVYICTPRGTMLVAQAGQPPSKFPITHSQLPSSYILPITTSCALANPRHGFVLLVFLTPLRVTPSLPHTSR